MEGCPKSNKCISTMDTPNYRVRELTLGQNHL
nr:MAG TPA: hypothetical protein [Caudoviricetes sp.]